MTPSVTCVSAQPARSSSAFVTSLPPPSTRRRRTANAFGVERDHLAVAHEPFVGEIQREALEREVSICVHRRAGEPLPHRVLTVI